MPEAVKTRGATRANRIAVALILVASVALVAVVCPACSRSSTRQSDLRDGADSDTHAPTDVAEINEPDLVLPEDMADDASDVPDEGDVPDDVVRVDPSAIPIADEFVHGVAAFEPTPTAVLIWTRYSGSATLIAVVYPQTKGAEWVEGTEQRLDLPQPNDEGIVIVDATGLTPSTAYRYFFAEVDEAGTILRRSEFGRFVTAPNDTDSPVITFAHTSCAKASYQPFKILSALAKEEISFFVFNGDLVYADGSKTLEEYRQHYRYNWDDDGLRALRAATAIYAILDDHEIDNNFNPEEFDPTRLGYALTAYKEYAPLRVDSEKPNRFWRTQRWGRTLELIILDSRTERLPSKKQYISGEQMEWLKSRLLNTPARFKFIVNTVPIAKFPIDNPDGWSGYDSQRNEILGYIESHEIKHVYWLSGDMHAAMVFDLGAGGWDLVASPIGQLHIGAWDVLSALDEVKYINGNVNNYMLVTADPTHDPPQVRISLRTDDGSEIYSQTFQ